MRMHWTATVLLLLTSLVACNQFPRGGNGARDAMSDSTDAALDPELTNFIASVRAVDNHSHANSVAPDDSEADALPPEVLMPFDVPATLRPENPNWLAAYRAIYGYSHAELSDAHMAELRGAMHSVAKAQGDKFPEWVLDRIGTEVMLANRVAMGPGLAPPRFRWVSYVDALMLPLSTKKEGAATPDREKLYPLEEKLLKRYLAELHVERLPTTFDAYLRAVVTATLERQRQAGCVAVKVEAALLRSLDFDDAPLDRASSVYERYVAGGEPSNPEYKVLQDFLFRYIAREAGRLGMAVHIHSFHAPGAFYKASGSDPLLLEAAFNDPTIRSTKFVIVHGGGIYASHAGAMLWKPNVYLDMSAMTLIYAPATLAGVLREWLLQFPEKVLFGTDAAAFGPDTGWELAAWIATTNGRKALAMALTDMMRQGTVSRGRAEEIATMVMRTNAEKLYNLSLK